MSAGRQQTDCNVFRKTADNTFKIHFPFMRGHFVSSFTQPLS